MLGRDYDLVMRFYYKVQGRFNWFNDATLNLLISYMCVEEMLSGSPLGIKTLFFLDISGMLKGILSGPGLVVSISISSAGFLRRNLPLAVLVNGKTSMGMCLWFLLMRIY